MDFDVVLLSRKQIALTIMFHHLFPPFSIELGILLVFMEGMFLKTGDKQYEQMTRFFTKLFAVNFALGVATGIQFLGCQSARIKNLPELFSDCSSPIRCSPAFFRSRFLQCTVQSIFI